MSVSVSMPQLGESVTEGTVTRWLKKEGERVEVDEPLLEVSTDKVDTEIPSPASGILRGIAVDEDETVAVGAQLAVIDDGESGDAAPAADDSASSAPAEAAEPAQPQAAQPQAAQAQSGQAQPGAAEAEESAAGGSQPAAETAQAPADSDGWSSRGSQLNYAPPAQSSPAASPGYSGSSAPSTPAYAPPPAYGQSQSSRPYGEAAPYGQAPAADATSAANSAPAADATPAADAAPAAAAADAAPAAQGQPSPDEPAPAADARAEQYPPPTPLPSAGEAPYVTPLVRKLAAEHAVDLESVTGTGVGGRIRKQDVIEAGRAQRAAQAAQPPAPAQPAQPQQPAQAAQPAQGAQLAQPAAQAQGSQPQAQAPARAAQSAAAPRPAVVPSSLRGTTQRMSRPRQVIAQRMVESLRVSAQLTTVVEADVTAIARLRDQARQDFEAREGVKLSFLPFFALAAVEALKVHPKLNAVIDGDQVTYHDTEHLGIAVDTERGLMVPVIHSAGDLNIGGLARKISDLASRTRSGQVTPDELAGGTFTLTNTGSRGALFDTPIINQPQVAILGTGTVVKRPVVVEDPALGEVIAVRSMVYLALTYDHRLVDGADAARFLTTVKNRLEEGAFEAELGL
jgi:pyruvate dehydrogenase E2 component (dihydrolipoamide acetyltransferase)